MYLLSQILGLVTPFIDNWSHLGGILYGACCACSTIEPLAVGFFGVDITSFWAKARKLVVKFGGLIVSVVLIMVTTVWLATTSDPTESPCDGCRYVSCVPFPFFQEDKWWYCDDCDFVTADLFKNAGGTAYERIELTCPDETVEMIDISADMLSTNNDVGKRLPTYCRDHCDSAFN